MRYRKMLSEVDAIQFTGDNTQEIWDQFGIKGIYGYYPDRLGLMTTDGYVAIARIGDWVVPDSREGTFYPIKPDVFTATYVPTSDVMTPASPPSQQASWVNALRYRIVEEPVFIAVCRLPGCKWAGVNCCSEDEAEDDWNDHAAAAHPEDEGS